MYGKAVPGWHKGARKRRKKDGRKKERMNA
jgi:hypothetical protein